MPVNSSGIKVLTTQCFEWLFASWTFFPFSFRKSWSKLLHNQTDEVWKGFCKYTSKFLLDLSPQWFCHKDIRYGKSTASFSIVVKRFLRHYKKGLLAFRVATYFEKEAALLIIYVLQLIKKALETYDLYEYLRKFNDFASSFWILHAVLVVSLIISSVKFFFLKINFLISA